MVSDFYWRICWHEEARRKGSSTLKSLIRYRLNHPDDPPLFAFDSTYQCHHCMTDYQIDLKPDSSGYNIILVITEWQDFGRILTPYDSRWRDHFVLYGKDYKSFTPRNIKRAFEGNHFNFNALITSQDEKKLTNRINS
jgi:hypothetical protein